MNSKYEQEIQEFHRNFASWREKNLVLYGIGRYTATLLDGLKGFHIIGLMDKDPENIGKECFGIPILSNSEVREQADAVIINTAGTYWNLIYQRIKNLGIPVYYRNGEMAKDVEVRTQENPYWNSSLEELCKKISEAEVVSFDFFDTLFSRMVCDPRDALQLLEKRLHSVLSEDKVHWMELRSKALQQLPQVYCLDELYEAMRKIGGISSVIVETAKQIEVEMELQLLVPRKLILECMKQAIHAGKDVYLVTDMYLPENYFIKAMAKQGIRLAKRHIIISGTLGKCKADGSLWQHFRQQIGNKCAVHVGDHPFADIKEAKKYGIDAYYVASTWHMLSLSSLSSMESRVCNVYASLIIGGVISKLFQNPFTLNTSKGIPRIETNFEMGYCIFGPVLLTFFVWLLRQARKDGIGRLVFMSRDGYFLKEDFEEYLACSGDRIENCYIGISRQLAMTAAVETEEDIWKLVDMPYTGSLSELLEDRFEIYVADVVNRDDIKKYLPQIRSHIKGIRQRYKRYLDEFKFNELDAIVDIGYYGNNQRYLNMISGTNMRGYYFNANLSQENENACHQSMRSCFQRREDISGKESGILKYQIYLESFLTAPYGMVKDIDDDGGFICKEKRQNQLHFPVKKEINDGVKAYIRDFMMNFKDIDIEEDVAFVDGFYRTCFEENMEFNDEVKKSFFNDNAMMHRMEANLFF